MTPLFITIFLLLFGIVLAAFALGFKFLETTRSRTVSAVLGDKSNGGLDAELPSVLTDKPRGAPVGGWIGRFGFAEALQARINQAGMDTGVAQLFQTMAFLAVIGALSGKFFPFLVFPWLTVVVMALTFGLLPLLYVNFKRNRRLNEFEAEFPEALDFLARSMRAGHAFSISLDMLGQESPGPLGQEFRTLFHELNLGSPINIALTNMARRVPLVDVRFFVSAIMLQRQTGGNLSEILTRLAFVIRERFKLRGQIRAASAHGRITAAILTILPLVTMLALFIVAPGYLQSMAADEDGKWLIVAALAGQLIGYFTMRRIITIKV